MINQVNRDNNDNKAPGQGRHQAGLLLGLLALLRQLPRSPWMAMITLDGSDEGKNEDEGDHEGDWVPVIVPAGTHACGHKDSCKNCIKFYELGLS